MNGNLKAVLNEIVNQLEAIATRVAAHEAALLERAALQPGDINHDVDSSLALPELAKVRIWIASLPE